MSTVPSETCASIEEAKKNLRTILSEHNGDTKHEKVLEAIETLSSLWKESGVPESVAPAYSDLIRGDWKILSSPSFPNRIENENDPSTFQYTLGRMSFNMFEPKDTVVTVCHPGMLNPVQPLLEEDGGDTETSKKATYNVINNIILHTENGDLPAQLVMDGYCFPKTDTRLTVGFTAGTLCKGPEVEKDETLLKLWNETFEGVYAKTEETRSYTEYAMRKVLSFLMKMTMPSDDSMKFEMKRVVHGYLDVLYLDKELRITRGNEGSVVVVEQ